MDNALTHACTHARNNTNHTHTHARAYARCVKSGAVVEGFLRVREDGVTQIKILLKEILRRAASGEWRNAEHRMQQTTQCFVVYVCAYARACRCVRVQAD